MPIASMVYAKYKRKKPILNVAGMRSNPERELKQAILNETEMDYLKGCTNITKV